MARILNKLTKFLLTAAVAAVTVPPLGAAQVPESLTWDARSTEGVVLGEGEPGGLDGTVSCGVTVNAAPTSAYEGTVKCSAGTTTVVCCSYQLVLGVSQGFTGQAQVQANFSGGGQHTWRCTWTAPAGTVAPSCASFSVPPNPFVGEIANVTGQATGSSATGSWSFTATFRNPA